MADDDTTMFQRQSASDLLWGMSHRQAIAHAVPECRLARQLEAAIPSSPAFGQLLSPDRLVAAPPDLGRPGTAAQLPAYQGLELRCSSRLIVDGARSSADAISF